MEGKKAKKNDDDSKPIEGDLGDESPPAELSRRKVSRRSVVARRTRDLFLEANPRRARSNGLSSRRDSRLVVTPDKHDSGEDDGVHFSDVSDSTPTDGTDEMSVSGLNDVCRVFLNTAVQHAQTRREDESIAPTSSINGHCDSLLAISKSIEPNPFEIDVFNFSFETIRSRIKKNAVTLPPQPIAIHSPPQWSGIGQNGLVGDPTDGTKMRTPLADTLIAVSPMGPATMGISPNAISPTSVSPTAISPSPVSPPSDPFFRLTGAKDVMEPEQGTPRPDADSYYDPSKTRRMTLYRLAAVKLSLRISLLVSLGQIICALTLGARWSLFSWVSLALQLVWNSLSQLCVIWRYRGQYSWDPPSNPEDSMLSRTLSTIQQTPSKLMKSLSTLQRAPSAVHRRISKLTRRGTTQQKDSENDLEKAASRIQQSTSSRAHFLRGASRLETDAGLDAALRQKIDEQDQKCQTAHTCFKFLAAVSVISFSIVTLCLGKPVYETNEAVPQTTDQTVAPTLNGPTYPPDSPYNIKRPDFVPALYITASVSFVGFLNKVAVNVWIMYLYRKGLQEYNLLSAETVLSWISAFYSLEVAIVAMCLIHLGPEQLDAMSSTLYYSKYAELCIGSLLAGLAFNDLRRVRRTQPLPAPTNL